MNTVMLTTIYPRMNGLRSVIRRLLPQCDLLQVYLHGYPSGKLPVWLHGSGLRVITEAEGGGDRASFDKHYQPPAEGIILTVDDDITYPRDYVKETVKRLQDYPEGTIVTYHGARLLGTGPYTEWSNAMRKLYHFWANVPNDTPVHIGGTGVMARRATDSWIDPVAGRAECVSDDLFVADYAQQCDRPIIVLKHRAQWLRPNTVVSQNVSISRYIRKDNQSVLDILNRNVWRLPEVRYGYSI